MRWPLSRFCSCAAAGCVNPIAQAAHGSAPDIAGHGKANPLAAILSLAMLLRHSLGREADAGRIERAVAETLGDGVLGADLGGTASTEQIAAAVVSNLLSIS